MDYSDYFCGEDGYCLDYAVAKYVIVPVPYDGTSTWIKGADKGPEAIIEASGTLEMYDIPTGLDVSKKGIFTDDPVLAGDAPEHLVAAVEKRIAECLDNAKLPVVVGGEHSVSVGAFQAFAKHYKELSIVQFDAHADLRDSYEGSKYNHACAMARAKELAPIVQIGIRSACKEDMEAMTEGSVFFRKYIRNQTSWHSEVVELLKDNVYLTIDLDVFDPSIMPSTGTPEPDGMLFEEVLAGVERIARYKTIVGFDVVELCPNPQVKAPDYLAAKLIYRILSIIEKYKQ